MPGPKVNAFWRGFRRGMEQIGGLLFLLIVGSIFIGLMIGLAFVADWILTP